LLAGDGETRVVVSVGCVNCGERYFRAHQRHRPDATERNAHKLAGRPVINGRGMI
jgi:predicted  nucleic acid-binding Zn-ribbon protein